MGLTMVRMLVTVCVVFAGLADFCRASGNRSERTASSWNFTGFGHEHFGVERAQIQDNLAELPGGQLAIVRYSARHDPFDEWVCKQADSDGSKVIWARDASDNLELIRYYGNRKVWLVEPDVFRRGLHPTRCLSPRPPRDNRVMVFGAHEPTFEEFGQ